MYSGIASRHKYRTHNDWMTAVTPFGEVKNNATTGNSGGVFSRNLDDDLAVLSHGFSHDVVHWNCFVPTLTAFAYVLRSCLIFTLFLLKGRAGTSLDRATGFSLSVCIVICA